MAFLCTKGNDLQIRRSIAILSEFLQQSLQLYLQFLSYYHTFNDLKIFITTALLQIVARLISVKSVASATDWCEM